MKNKIWTAKGKVTRVVNQLRVSDPTFIELLEDNTEKELDRAALGVQNQWNRLEQGISDLDNTANKMTEAINKVDAKNLAEDPDVLVKRTNKEIEDFSQDYLNFKKESFKEVRKALSRIEDSDNE